MVQIVGVEAVKGGDFRCLGVPAIPHTNKEGKEIYQWEQSLEEVNIFIRPPDWVKAKDIECTITQTHLTIGVKGNPPFLNADLGGNSVSKESYWTMNDGEIQIQLQKQDVGTTWGCAFKGHAKLDPLHEEEAKQRILLERFQRENPGFDFSNAKFSGSAPDAKTFMGGINTTKLQ